MLSEVSLWVKPGLDASVKYFYIYAIFSPPKCMGFYFLALLTIISFFCFLLNKKTPSNTRFVCISTVGLDPDQQRKEQIQVGQSFTPRTQVQEARLNMNVETRTPDCTKMVSKIEEYKISALEIDCYECRVDDRDHFWLRQQVLKWVILKC